MAWAPRARSTRTWSGSSHARSRMWSPFPSSRSSRRTSKTSMRFLFSSRRRHTRLQGDWSSDVCSSDLSVPIIGTVNIKSESTATQLKNDIVAGAIDMAYRTLNPQDITSLQIQASSLGLKVDFGASPQFRDLVFNVKTAPFNNVLLRRAIAYAVDRSLIINSVFNSQVGPLWTMIPTVMNYSIPVFQLIYGSVPNLTQAGNLLSQYGLSIFQTLDISKNHL